jgi:hypothetical protein
VPGDRHRDDRERSTESTRSPRFPVVVLRLATRPGARAAVWLQRRGNDGSVMIEPSGERVRWNVGRSRLRRRAGSDAVVLATNGSALLVHVTAAASLEIGAHVDIAFESGACSVAIRHVAPTGRPEDGALVGVELLRADESLQRHLDERVAASQEAGARDRWWWQSGGVASPALDTGHDPTSPGRLGTDE